MQRKLGFARKITNNGGKAKNSISMKMLVLLATTASIIALIPIAGAFAVTLSGTNENDSLRGTNNSDTIYGKGGNDKIYGYDADDKLYGGRGDDRIEGGSGADYIYGWYGGN